MVGRTNIKKVGLKKTEAMTAGEREARRGEEGRSAHQFCGGVDPPEPKRPIIVTGGQKYSRWEREKKERVS